MRVGIVAVAVLAGLALAGCAAAPGGVTGSGQVDGTPAASAAVAAQPAPVTVTAQAPVTAAAPATVTVQPPVTVVAPAPRTVTAPAPAVVVVPAPDSYPGYYYTAGVTGLPAGLFCRDLKALGYTWSDATQYWIGWGRPDNMDADLNGIPCETVY